jgi:serine protease Do
MAVLLAAIVGLGDRSGHRGAQGAGSTTTLPKPLDVPALTRRAAQSTVGIDPTSTGATAVPTGSGIVLSSTGMVVTTERIAGQTTTVEVRLPDGSTRVADLVGSDAGGGVALLQIRDVQGLSPAELADQAAHVGDEVVAVGTATTTRGSSSSEGVVSADGAEATVGAATLDGLLQSDAVVAPAGAGGPLVDRTGKVVGMSIAIDGGATGNGYAIPVDTLRSRIEALEANQGKQTPNSPTLGVKTEDVASLSPASVSANGVTTSDGAMITEVDRRSTAHDADLRVGDVITAVDAQVVNNTGDLVAAIANHHRGDQVVVTFARRGQIGNVRVTLRSIAETGN